MKIYQTALVIGGGAFGTSIASVLVHNFNRVVVKVYEEDVYLSMKDNYENHAYLPGKKLDPNILPALTWEEVKELVLGNVDVIIEALPSAILNGYLDQYYDDILYYLKTGVPLVSLTKGIDSDSLKMADSMLTAYFNEFKEQFAYLSGPSFASEIVDKQITIVSLAGKDYRTLTNLVSIFNTPYFKVLPSYDIKGVLLGGSLKNVLAIASGIIQELGYNHNTLAAMLTRGVTEMLRFGKVFNARPETFHGLSGMGDLILTTTGDLSRNKTFGKEIARGKKAETLISQKRYVVEGYKTSLAAHRISEKYLIRARIFNGVYQVLYEDRDPMAVISNIMATPSSFEW